ncbi:MAG: hypothetical protein AAGA30_06140, partial [Planctomycetota bacterium]
EESSEEPQTEEQSTEPERPEAFQKYDQELLDYQTKKAEYEMKLTEFQDEQSEFNKKIAEGQKLVDELNERFGAWFYVISADNLKSLQLNRSELVSEKEKLEADIEPANTEPAGLPNRPNIILDDTPTEESKGESQTPTETDTVTNTEPEKNTNLDQPLNVDGTEKKQPESETNAGDDDDSK